MLETFVSNEVEKIPVAKEVNVKSHVKGKKK